MSKDVNTILFSQLSEIIITGKQHITSNINSVLTLTYWQIGAKINEHILNNKRADYGEKVVVNISKQLEKKFGRSFTVRNVRRMLQFAEQFNDLEIVTPLVTQLSWTHFLQLLPLKSMEAKLFYARKSIEEKWSKRVLISQIERKAFERNEIASLQTIKELEGLQNTFKDPYFLGFLGLKDGYLENDLETAIIKEIENFILELGVGFSFIERQKRIILDSKDFYLDLLFFHRKLKRLVAIELKIGEFKPAHKGQMELYLKWLNKNEKQEGENTPIGLILCAGKSNEQIELLEMHKDGIMVAEYWTDLPPKKELEQKLQTLVLEAKARIAQQKRL
ncbi:PDDEXK nuclease domain-containing protein [uncultured Polaribacter sp.]|uniref:PDDEXK nuclease domain-containing protein n=1 Tax=uncultured Polaribacter sp. TaxID=174711 RepID=UPI002638887D|nr:PDDEXK nuclease domain-containing protein [uncultured Polaribacter sp.]